MGIVHPCKIYNILALGIPFLYIGPEVSHITEMLPAERRVAELVDCVAHGAEGRACRQAKPPAPQWAARRGGDGGVHWLG